MSGNTSEISAVHLSFPEPPPTAPSHTRAAYVLASPFTQQCPVLNWVPTSRGPRVAAMTSSLCPRFLLSLKQQCPVLNWVPTGQGPQVAAMTSSVCPRFSLSLKQQCSVLNPVPIGRGPRVVARTSSVCMSSLLAIH